jgi:hypothetical protein
MSGAKNYSEADQERFLYEPAKRVLKLKSQFLGKTIFSAPDFHIHLNVHRLVANSANLWVQILIYLKLLASHMI